jgi:hypothetical protein
MPIATSRIPGLLEHLGFDTGMQGTRGRDLPIPLPTIRTFISSPSRMLFPMAVSFGDLG